MTLEPLLPGKTDLERQEEFSLKCSPWGGWTRQQTPLQPLQLYWLKPTDFPGEVGDGHIMNIPTNMLERTRSST